MYTVRPTSKFSKDLKRVERQGYKIEYMTDLIKKLANAKTLGKSYQDHALKGEYEGCRECHYCSCRMHCGVPHTTR